MRNRIFRTTNKDAALLLAAAGLAGMLFAGTAEAAGRATPVYNWTGFYAGVNGGYAWHEREILFGANDILSDGFFGPGAAASAAGGQAIPPINFDVRGGFGGFQLGYDWQLGPNWIFGLETDLQYGRLKGTGTATHISVGFPSTGTVSESVKWFGTARARLGYLVGNDLLVYGTGGFAYGRVEQSASWTWGGPTIAFSFGPGTPGVVCTSGLPCYAGSSSSVETGWTIGGGAEWALWRNVTLKAEYLYVNLGRHSVTIVGSVVPSVNHLQSTANVSGEVDFHSARAGLNFRF